MHVVVTVPQVWRGKIRTLRMKMKDIREGNGLFLMYVATGQLTFTYQVGFSLGTRLVPRQI